MNLWRYDRDPETWVHPDGLLWAAGALGVVFGIGFLARLSNGEQSCFWVPALAGFAVLAVGLLRRRRKMQVG